MDLRVCMVRLVFEGGGRTLSLLVLEEDCLAIFFKFSGDFASFNKLSFQIWLLQCRDKHVASQPVLDMI